MKKKKIFTIAIITLTLLLITTGAFLLLNKQKTASLHIPTKGQYRIGEIFPVRITIAHTNTPINVVQADIQFDKEHLEAIGFSTQNSFATLFIQREIDNQKGWARLTGGLPNPGWSGTQGEFGTLYLKAKRSGLVTVNFLPSSIVLTNDEKGTNILKEMPSASYLILPETISQTEEKKQQQFISQPHVLGENTQRGQMIFDR